MDNSFSEGLATGLSTGNNGGFGDCGGAWWIIILFALFGMNGNGNWGNGGQQMGYDLGRVATTNDVANGFASSATLNSLNDIKLGQTSIQQTLCQGFSGVNATVVQNGYETRGAISDLAYRLQDCCCQTQRAIDSVNYNMAKNTCDLQRTIYDSNRSIIDYLVNEKMCALQNENSLLKGQISQTAQTNTIINTLRPVAIPAYIANSPFQTTACGYGNSCLC